MKLVIVRHAEPDYDLDVLTEKGRREAEYLSERLAEIVVKDCYVSPLGRARETAAMTLQKTGRTAVECEWLREFTAPIRRPDAPGRKTIPWDWLPQDWAEDERFYSPDRWFEHPAMQEGHVKEAYDWVIENFDALLERHGYRRNGRIYQAVHPNSDTILFFCHFGLECVLLSRLLNTSPMVLWHHTCALTSSVTTLVTEERREGTAIFRMSSFGDLSHLYAHGEPPSFAARFRECWTNKDERMD
ncbi:MAG: histidine phosphatase family protein [Oscillospiraceae bacterium]|nr:histidine phosphatase family protein [Oscillospiraceae bacterium]